MTHWRPHVIAEVAYPTSSLSDCRQTLKSLNRRRKIQEESLSQMQKWLSALRLPRRSGERIRKRGKRRNNSLPSRARDVTLTECCSANPVAGALSRT